MNTGAARQHEATIDQALHDRALEPAEDHARAYLAAAGAFLGVVLTPPAGRERLFAV
jgi:hypothetical protein